MAFVGLSDGRASVYAPRVFSLTALGFLLGTALPSDAPPLTLESAQAMALERSPLMAAARASLDAFEAQYREAWWAWWPKIDVKFLATGIPPQAEDADNTQVVKNPDGSDSGYRVVTGPDLDSWNFWMKFDVSGYIPLYTFGKISSLQAMSEHGVEVGHAAEKLAAAELRFQVARAWYGLALSSELKALIDDGEEQVRKARERLEKLDEEDSPEFDQADLFRLRIYESQVKKVVLGNRHLEAVSRTGLRVALGLREGETLALPEPMTLTRVSVDLGPIECYVDLAARQRPELAMKRHEVAVKRLEIDRKWADFFPDFFLAGSFTYAYSTVDQQDSAFSSTVFNALGGGGAIGFKLDLDYPGKLARYRKVEADAARGQAELDIAEAQLRVELEDVWRTASEQAELLSSAERSMKAARSLLVLRTHEYENGVDENTKFKDVLDSAVTYVTQKSEWLNATHAFNGAMIRLTRVVGEDVTRYQCPKTLPPAAPSSIP